jgi:putative DNA primase/helicase
MHSRHSAEIEINGREMTEEDVFKAQHFLQNDVDLPGITKTIVYEALQHHAFNNKYDEALEWLQGLEWDGTPRLTMWLARACGVPETQYYQAIGSQWMLGMVKRLVYPGSVFDHVLTMVGRQGLGKTSIFRIIGGDWYKSHTESVDNKDFFLKLRGACLIDLDEGATMNKSESIKIKSVITETVDEYRAPYDRVTQKYPRRFVFSMSTNDSEPFRDQTGNRRYWVVRLDQKADFAWLQDNRDQLFAEAYHVLMNHVELPEVPIEDALKMQDEATVKDEWYNAIVSWMSDRPGYRKGDPNFSITVRDVYEGALGGKEIYKIDKHTEMRIGTILRNDLHMVKRRVRVNEGYQNRFFLDEAEVRRLSEENKSDELHDEF